MFISQLANDNHAAFFITFSIGDKQLNKAAPTRADTTPHDTKRRTTTFSAHYDESSQVQTQCNAKMGKELTTITLLSHEHDIHREAQQPWT